MKEKGLFIGALVSLILFLLIAIGINGSNFSGLDNAASGFVLNNQNEILHNISVFISIIFEPMYVIIFVILLSITLFLNKKKEKAVILSISSLLAGVSIYLLKHVFLRDRPINMLFQEIGFSFPSGHAMIAMVLFGILIYYIFGMKSKAKEFFYIFGCILAILVIGFSRVYLNVHWFSDVIASYLFGIFILFFVFFVKKVIKKF